MLTLAWQIGIAAGLSDNITASAVHRLWRHKNIKNVPSLIKTNQDRASVAS